MTRWGRFERRYGSDDFVDFVDDQLNRWFLVTGFTGSLSLSFSEVGFSGGVVGWRGFVSRGVLKTLKWKEDFFSLWWSS